VERDANCYTHVTLLTLVYLECKDGDAEVEWKCIDGRDGGSVGCGRQVDEAVNKCDQQTDDRQQIGEHRERSEHSQLTNRHVRNQQQKYHRLIQPEVHAQRSVRFHHLDVHTDVHTVYTHDVHTHGVHTYTSGTAAGTLAYDFAATLYHKFMSSLSVSTFHINPHSSSNRKLAVNVVSRICSGSLRKFNKLFSVPQSNSFTNFVKICAPQFLHIYSPTLFSGTLTPLFHWHTRWTLKLIV